MWSMHLSRYLYGSLQLASRAGQHQRVAGISLLLARARTKKGADSITVGDLKALPQG
ncbi:MAG: hypothetical protein UY92_C0021G0009 [Candidatus Magasanikbacteria bacterium GW2011_GWA2_56_11]|uniref:Uncharacterized protein n=1 Tax=Candidatus Magasanikbacteria bacterium GW2011_GWA2_56_11 TaxID=1619044 RepID=A0A0G1YDV1_9BACT|nr:MAG: hypothetical protein UY92_C0021G0009 [Candidatus Magasanikbacteria bacterium GW2011_GWA2_56_11]